MALRPVPIVWPVSGSSLKLCVSKNRETYFRILKYSVQKKYVFMTFYHKKDKDKDKLHLFIFEFLCITSL